MLDFLKQMVEIETPSRDKLAQEEIFELLIKEFEDLNQYQIRIRGEETGGFLYSRPTSKSGYKDVQLLVGHCDTVWAIDTLQKMPIRQLNGKAMGPGIYDMKAGITQIIFALKTIKALNLRPSALPVVLINSDEEIGSFESTSAIKRLSRISKRAFIMEPPLGTEGKLKTERKGVGRFTIIVKGRAAHAGLDPGKGINAIVELSHQVQKLYAMNDFENGVSVNVGMIEGGYSPNVVAPQSKAVIDVRVKNNEDGEVIADKIYQLKPHFDDVELIIKGGMGRPPMERTPRNQLLWTQAEANGKLIGIDLEQASAGGGSDGNTTSLFTATLDGLGTVGDGAHAEHEYILTDTLIERTALLTLLLIDDIIET
ncbi:MAG: M20 family metallopeptidase [Bacteroidia bacterium]|nr:M20 family metallopeptidase [Bacteroidia bacterium]